MSANPVPKVWQECRRLLQPVMGNRGGLGRQKGVVGFPGSAALQCETDRDMSSLLLWEVWGKEGHKLGSVKISRWDYFLFDTERISCLQGHINLLLSVWSPVFIPSFCDFFSSPTSLPSYLSLKHLFCILPPPGIFLRWLWLFSSSAEHSSLSGEREMLHQSSTCCHCCRHWSSRGQSPLPASAKQQDGGKGTVGRQWWGCIMHSPFCASLHKKAKRLLSFFPSRRLPWINSHQPGWEVAERYYSVAQLWFFSGNITVNKDLLTTAGQP